MEENVLEGLTAWKGRITKVHKYPCFVAPGKEMLDYYSQLAGKPVYALKHDVYNGMCLDITFCLYDTLKMPIELHGKKYLIPRYVTIEIYKEVMEALGKQRMTAPDYEKLLLLEGEKKTLFLAFIEETLQKNENDITVEAACILPIEIGGKDIVTCTKIGLKEVL